MSEFSRKTLALKLAVGALALPGLAHAQLSGSQAAVFARPIVTADPVPSAEPAETPAPLSGAETAGTQASGPSSQTADAQIVRSQASAAAAPGAPTYAAAGVDTAKWSRTAMPWVLLPSGDAVGPFPKSIDIRPVAWDYSARSERIEVFGRQQPVIVRVTLQVKEGSVGVVLSSPDGSALVSKEAVLKPSAADSDVYFRVRPGSAPAIIIIRNYDGAGMAGSVLLKSVQFIREGDLSNDDLIAIVQKGLN